jgi:four helix bundle protein
MAFSGQTTGILGAEAALVFAQWRRRYWSMDALKSHRDLPVWKKSVGLAGKVYAATRSLPSDERFGLDQQLRQKAVALATNIAEGWSRRTRTEFLQYLHAARGALLEIEIRTLIAIGQGYFDATSDLPDEIAELGAVLNAMIRHSTVANQLAHAKACAPDHLARNRTKPNQSLPSTSSAS